MIAFPLVAALLVAQNPAPARDSLADAYRDPLARRLVAGARARRETIDRSITSYHATMRERIGVGIRALRRDRMLFRRELALRIHWFRDSTGSIEVLGARQAVPAATPVPELPDDLRRDAPDYAFDPADERLTIGWGSRDRDVRDTTERDRRGMRIGHPLADGSEAHYRFATGDSSSIVFADGRIIRLRELRVTPRRLDFRLVSGSFWIDQTSNAVVRALIRPARPFDFEQDLEDEDDDDIPGFVKPIKVEVRFITIDYGLWGGRWWLPRLIAMDAVATAGSLLQVPVRYELTYGDYEVTGDTAAPRAPRPAPAEVTLAEDSAARARCGELGEQFVCKCRNGRCRAFTVAIPTDTAALVASAELPPAFGGVGDTLISGGEMEQLARDIGALPTPPWQIQARPPRWGLARFNRVEGLSVGARGEIAFGRLQLDGVARIATADAELDVEAGLVRERTTVRYRLSGYRRLAAADPATRTLGLGNSLGSLLLGRDDGEYFRAAGVELTVVPAVTEAQRFSLRVFAEQQRGARKRTDFSVPHAFNRDHVFRPNIAADSADQLGAALTFRTQRGVDPEAARWGAEVTLDGGAGTYGFGRASGAVRFTTPLTRRLSAAFEVAGGMAAGRVPAQSLWYLGGPGTLRGYGGNVARGDAFWRGRAELGSRWPAARLVLFSDVGRAGARDHLSLARPLVSAGIGASFLDGLVRIDLARALRSPTGWRLDFYTDGAL